MFYGARIVSRLIGISGTQDVADRSDELLPQSRYTLPGANGYGAYVIVRTPATLPIVIVVPCEKPAG